MNKYHFLDWLEKEYPDIKLTHTQYIMLDIIFEHNHAICHFSRQSGKSFLIELIDEYYEYLLNKS